MLVFKFYKTPRNCNWINAISEGKKIITCSPAVSLQRLLQRCHSARASYLFQQDKFYDLSYDTGDKSVQCSRKPDAFKFWLMWKALGASELEQRVDRALAMARSVWLQGDGSTCSHQDGTCPDGIKKGFCCALW